MRTTLSASSVSGADCDLTIGLAISVSRPRRLGRRITFEPKITTIFRDKQTPATIRSAGLEEDRRRRDMQVNIIRHFYFMLRLYSLDESRLTRRPTAPPFPEKLPADQVRLRRAREKPAERPPPGRRRAFRRRLGGIRRGAVREAGRRGGSATRRWFQTKRGPLLLCVSAADRVNHPSDYEEFHSTRSQLRGIWLAFTSSFYLARVLKKPSFSNSSTMLSSKSLLISMLAFPAVTRSMTNLAVAAAPSRLTRGGNSNLGV